MRAETHQGLRGATSTPCHVSPFDARRWLWRLARGLALTSLALAVGVPAAVSAHFTATAPPHTPDALARAHVIRTEVNARYRPLPGRTLVVTEATGMRGEMLALWNHDWLEGRVVPMDNGIYFSICSARARCPYPAPRAAWPVAAFMPRRQALELALRTFLETSVSLAVISLPTAQPVWAVFERDDVFATTDARVMLGRLASSPALIEPQLRELVGQLTRPRLYAPAALGPDDSIVAVRLFVS